MIQRFFDDQRGELAESVITIPIVLLVFLAIFNLALAGYASTAAQNAANYGARRGSVAQENPAGVAYGATAQSLDQTMIGEYSIGVAGGGGPGSDIIVEVAWQVPNYFSGLGAIFPGLPTGPLSGRSHASFRQEGW